MSWRVRNSKINRCTEEKQVKEREEKAKKMALSEKQIEQIIKKLK